MTGLHVVLSFCNLALAAGGVIVIATLRFLARAKYLEGDIVGLIVHRTQLGNRIRPVLEICVRGEKIRFESQLARGSEAYRVGERVPVAFDPDDPWKARMATRLNLWLLPSVLIGLGLTVGVATVLLSSIAR